MKRSIVRFIAVAVVFASFLGAAVLAHAQSTPDPVGLQLVNAGHGKVRLTVTAGSSGAPNGFEVCWMTRSEFDSYGDQWPPPWVAGEGWDDFTGVGTLNTWGASAVDFKLGPGQSLDVEIGDTADETGVGGTRNAELTGGETYVFCAYAIGGSSGSSSPLSVTLQKNTTVQGSNCTYTQGYWKNHTGVWPVSGLTLGTVAYTAAQLEQILLQPVGNGSGANGLISLAHQLIAAKLNLAGGADGSSISSTITSADALIGGLVVPPVGTGYLDPSSSDALTQALDDFNQGVTGPGHCGETPTHRSTWGALKSAYR
jgi:hypothetical protein